ncbi:TPA: hypothetical protein RXC39_005144, partial [Escherichia coli]|nr:hypothetical protein [Escherichia coli]
MKAWHVAALFAAVFFLKGAVTASGGWFMGLLGLHDFFGWEAPSYFEGAAWMAAFA